MFDEHGFVSKIRECYKFISIDSRVVYTVQMRSFNCVPEPNGPAQVDERTERYLIENINAKKRPKTTTPRPVEKDQEDAKFDEQTFELPEEMPAVSLVLINKPNDCSISGRTGRHNRDSTKEYRPPTQKVGRRWNSSCPALRGTCHPRDS